MLIELKVRCWAHIALGIMVGSLWIFGVAPAIICAVLAYAYVSYQKQQDKNKLTQSYLDIREFAVVVAVTFLVTLAIVKMIVGIL